MNFGGIHLRTLRKKRGLSQEDVAPHAGMSKATMHRIEQGTTKLPSDQDIENFAFALRCDSAVLIESFDQDRIAQGLKEAKEREDKNLLPSPPLLQDQATLVRMFENHRMFGRPEETIILARTFKERWESEVDSQAWFQQPELKRLLMQASLTWAYAFTLTTDSPHLVRQIKNDRMLSDYRGYLSAEDEKYRGMALLLTGLWDYLAKDYRAATASLPVALNQITDPYVYGLGMRDVIVSSSRLGDRTAFDYATAEASEMLSGDDLPASERARLLEGMALGECYFGNQRAETYLQQAKEGFRLAEQEGTSRPSIESQIARTEIHMALANIASEEEVANNIQDRIVIFQRNGYNRFIEQIRHLLNKSRSGSLQKLALSFGAT